MDEEKLISFLGNLPPTSFNQVLIRLPEADKHVPDRATHLDRVADLIRYVRSATGPGMGRLAEVVHSLYPDKYPFSDTQPPNDANNSNVDDSGVSWWKRCLLFLKVMLPSFLNAHAGSRAGFVKVAPVLITVLLFTGWGIWSSFRKPCEVVQLTILSPSNDANVSSSETIKGAIGNSNSSEITIDLQYTRDMGKNWLTFDSRKVTKREYSDFTFSGVDFSQCSNNNNTVRFRLKVHQCDTSSNEITVQPPSNRVASHQGP